MAIGKRNKPKQRNALDGQPGIWRPEAVTSFHTRLNCLWDEDTFDAGWSKSARSISPGVSFRTLFIGSSSRGNEGKRLLGRPTSRTGGTKFCPEQMQRQSCRMTIRGLGNVAKCYLIHAVAYNRGLVMRSFFGPRYPEGDGRRPQAAYCSLFHPADCPFKLSPIRPRSHYQAADSIFSSVLMATQSRGDYFRETVLFQRAVKTYFTFWPIRGHLRLYCLL